MQNISCHIHYHNKVQPNDKEVMVNISHTLDTHTDTRQHLIHKFALFFCLAVTQI